MLCLSLTQIYCCIYIFFFWLPDWPLKLGLCQRASVDYEYYYYNLLSKKEYLIWNKALHTEQTHTVTNHVT